MDREEEFQGIVSALFLSFEPVVKAMARSGCEPLGPVNDLLSSVLAPITTVIGDGQHCREKVTLHRWPPTLPP